MLWLVLRWLISVDYLCNSGSVAVEFSSEAFNHFEGKYHGSMYGRALGFCLWFILSRSMDKMDGWMDKMNRWTRWMDGWMDGWMNV